MGFLEDKSIDITAICETWIPDQCTPTTAVIKGGGVGSPCFLLL